MHRFRFEASLCGFAALLLASAVLFAQKYRSGPLEEGASGTFESAPGSAGAGAFAQESSRRFELVLEDAEPAPPRGNPFQVDAGQVVIPLDEIGLPDAPAPDFLLSCPLPTIDPAQWFSLRIPLPGRAEPAGTLGLSPEEFSALLAAAPPAAPPSRTEAPANDVITLKNGGVLEGKILGEEKDSVTIRTAAGVTTVLQASKIASVRRAWTPSQMYHERSASLEPGDSEGRLELAKWCLQKELREEAERELEKYLSAGGRSSDAAVELGKIYRRSGRLEDELGVYESFLQHPAVGSEGVWNRLGSLCEVLGTWEHAAQAYQKALALAPFNGFARAGLIRAHLELGRLDEAERELRRMPPGTDPAVDAAAFRAEISLRQGKWSEVAEAAQTAREPLGLVSSAVAYMAARGTTEEKALNALKQAVRLAPDRWEVWCVFGFLLLGAGYCEEARQMFEKALRVSPVAVEAQIGLAQAWEVAGRRDKAQEASQKALHMAPGHPFARYCAAHLALQDGDAELALLHHRAILGRIPQADLLLYERAFCVYWIGYPQEAVRLLERLKSSPSTQAPAQMRAQFLRALCLAKARELRQAREELEDLGKTVGRAHEKELLWRVQEALAAVDLQAGRFEEARRRFREVLGQSPDSAYSKRALESLETALVQRVRAFRFAGKTLGSGWTIAAPPAFAPKVDQGALMLEFREGSNAQGPAFLERAGLPFDRLREFQAEFDFSASGNLRSGIFLRLPAGEQLSFGRTELGQWAWAFGKRDGQSLSWNSLEVADLPAEASAQAGVPLQVSLGLRVDPSTPLPSLPLRTGGAGRQKREAGKLTLLLGGAPVGAVEQQTARRSGGKCSVGLFVEPVIGSEGVVRVKEFRVAQDKETGKPGTPGMRD